MYRSKFQYVPLIALGLLLFIGSASASAGTISDIPDAVADSLGISVVAAEMVLTAAILLSAGMALAMLKGSNTALIVIVELGLLGMLTAIGWVDAWLIVMVALILALIFGASLRDWGEATFSKRQ